MKTFTIDEAIEIAKIATSRAFQDMSEEDLLQQEAFEENMAIYIDAAFKEAPDTDTNFNAGLDAAIAVAEMWGHGLYMVQDGEKHEPQDLVNCAARAIAECIRELRKTNAPQ